MRGAKPLVRSPDHKDEGGKELLQLRMNSDVNELLEMQALRRFPKQEVIYLEI